MITNYQIKKSNKFKTNYLSTRFVVRATKENATYASLLSMYLVYTNNIDKTYKVSSDKLDSLYGTKVDINVSLKGNDLVFDFILSCVAAKYVKNDKDYLKEVINSYITYIINPLASDNQFDSDVFNLKKYELNNRIKASYDDKAGYALEQFYNHFGQEQPIGINVLGYESILDKINEKSLYDFYLNMMKQVPLFSGMVDDSDYENINEYLKSVFEVQNYNNKLSFYNIKSEQSDEFIEMQNIVQSKLVLGYYSRDKLDQRNFYIGLLFNALFGMSSNSYLFKIVREKENLCYTIRSNYDFYSNSIIVFAGINHTDYSKAVQLIEDILKSMQEGKIADEQLSDAKTVMIDIISKTSDSQAALTSFYTNRMMQNFPTDLKVDIKNINAITKEDIVLFSKAIELKTKYLLSGETNE